MSHHQQQRQQHQPSMFLVNGSSGAAPGSRSGASSPLPNGAGSGTAAVDGSAGSSNGTPARSQPSPSTPPYALSPPHPPQYKSAAHHAIKIIPEDVELSTGLQRSRSSSVQLQLHLPPSFSADANANGHGESEKDSFLLRPSNIDITPPLPSPSMLKPFRPNPTLRRRGLVYILSVVAGCATFVVFLIVLLSSSTTTSSSHAAALRKDRAGGTISSYLGTYLPFLSAYSTAGMSLTSSAILFGHSAPGIHTLHPILPILRKAAARNADLVSRQSTTYSQAVAQYKQRYRRDPPKGFEKWWSFAKARNHTMVDEYDGMMRDVLRFAPLAPEVLRQRTRTLSQLPGVSLITIKNGQAQIHSKSGKWAPALALQEMMNAFVGQLPDMEIAVNEKPEGRVLPGRWKEVNADDWGEDEFPLIESEQNQTDPLAAQLTGPGGFKADWRRDGSVWEAFRRACPPDSAARRLVESLRSAESSTNSRQMRLQMPSAAQQQQSDVVYSASLSRRRAEQSGALPRTRELSFNSELDSSFDLCAYPSLHSLHAAFFSDTRSIQHLYPLFSPSKPNGFADLLIPFHQYWSPPSEVTYENDFKKGRSKVPADVEWDQKDDKVFWRGKVARGAETPPGHFSSLQKPRLVSLANDDGSTWSGKDSDLHRHKILPRIPPHRVLVTVNASSSSLVSVSAPGPKINEYVMDVALACDPQLGECAEQQRLGYRVASPSPMSEAWRHKYALDLDEVGLSPRFPALMESHCAVVKSSVQKEFWNDWITPWYHYIPLSSSYAEIYNIQSFFSGFPRAFQHRRSTSASAPKKDDAAAVAAGSADIPDNDDEAADDTSADAVTLKTEAITLQPINPAHGPLFDGDLALKDIADQGSAWRKEHMRREDMEVYVFRLLLEWARLVAQPSSHSGSGKKKGQ